MPKEGDIVFIVEAGKTTAIDSQEAFSDFIHSSCTQNVTYAIAHMLLLRIEALESKVANAAEVKEEALRKLATPDQLFISESTITQATSVTTL